MLKKLPGLSVPLRWRKGPTRLTETPGTHDGPGQRPSAANEKGGKKRRKKRKKEKKGTDPIWFRSWHEVRYSDKHTSPPYL